MRLLIRSIGVLCVCMFSLHACTQELKIVFSQYTPPYVFEDGTGILVDIVRSALETKGYKITPVCVPISRGFKMFADKEVDGTTIIQESSGLKAFYSDNFMQYHNRAFSLKSRKLSVKKVPDLRGKSIIAFQNARNYMGSKFAAVVADNAGYKELAEQDAQVLMLLEGRVDVAVMDESIFHYYMKKFISQGKVDPSIEVDGADIFPPTPYKAAFSDQKIRDEFNAGISAMKADGRYQSIYKAYEEKYFPVRK